MDTIHTLSECAATSVNKFQRAAEEWRITFDAISDPIAIQDRDHCLVRVNRAYARAVGASPESLIGKKYYEVFNRGAGPRDTSLQEKVFQTGETVTEEFFEPFLNTFIEMSVSPIRDEKGEITRTIHIIKSIAERKKAEEVLRRDKATLENIVHEKSAELLSAQKELEDARRLSDIGVLAATIAHEIRNPLAAIRTAAYNIRRKVPLPSITSHLANIDKKVLESDQIIKNLLSYSRIRLPDYAHFSLHDMIYECIRSAHEKYSRAQVSVRKDIRFPPDTIIEADQVHLRVVISNILDNAYQSMESGKGNILIDAFCAHGMFHISFTDTGIGIPREFLPHVAEPFFTNKSKGVGLGLTICAQIVNLHKGSFNIESEQGKGTIVTVILPVARMLPFSDKGEMEL